MASKPIPVNPLDARFDDAPLSHWQGLHGAAQSLAIVQAAARHPGVTLVVTRSGHQANLLERDLELFAPDGLEVLHFPDWETLPYDLYSPHPDIISRRLATLAALPSLRQGIVLLPVATLMQRLSPTDYVLGRSITLDLGQSLDLERFRLTLDRAGYEAVEQVIRPGQFAQRGSILDLFAMGSPVPHRIELFDREIESIRSFDTDSQRSLETLQQVRLLPGREYPFGEEAIEDFRRAFRLAFDIDTRRCPLYQDLRDGIHPQGLEYYLPLFFERTQCLTDYLAEAPRWVLQDGVVDAAQDFSQQLEERYEQRRHDLERPVLPPAELYFESDDILTRMEAGSRVQILDQPGKTGAQPVVDFGCQAAPDTHIHEKAREPAQALAKLAGTEGLRVLIAADSRGRREVIADTLRAFGLKPRPVDHWAAFAKGDPGLSMGVLPLSEGFACDAAPSLVVLTETQLFGGRIRQVQPGEARERDPESIIRDLADLHVGAPVVHEDHGVGRYQGLEVLDIDGESHEFLMLEYAGGDKLYVPVASLGLISRYTGSPAETAPLHSLGGDRWSRIRRKAAEKARDVAAELLNLYARRQARPGQALPLDEKLYRDFSSTFAFEETPDQERAIEAVLDDLRQATPMDRVICGDVGFGKTEVALRAAFVAVQAGRQVALLVPTTLLAQQHYSLFADRFADWPVRVEVLSRFRTGKQSEGVLAELANGKVDIIIGTHRLIQKDIRFKDLGLVILDEEQRFGVRQKERLKELRAEVDVLTLTATPIPRTLNMALSGLRDLSIIATPPKRRMAVKTFVTPWDKAVIREALQRELQRGGQVYFLHNEVQTIERVARELGELMPQARIRIGHGQMHERELEQVMGDFYRQKFNVLVATTIIESGIDVPSANTIIINRADKFGLAQLHQLRGRVGRSHHRAYAYLLIPDRRSITSDAKKRLEAIESMEELGAGFTLATHDLEIRGAGELLGDEQSGQIHEIGFSLYMDLLGRAVEALRAGREPELDQPLGVTSDIDLQAPALIPDDYLPDVHTRLTLYKRIASAADAERLRELQVEMIDRFGLLPRPTQTLFEITRLRQMASRHGIRKVSLGEDGGSIQFEAKAQVDPAAMIRLIQQQPDRYRLEGPEKLRVLGPLGDVDARLQLLDGLFRQILQKVQPA